MKAFYFKEYGEIAKLDQLSRMTRLNRSELLRRIIRNLDLSPQSVQREFGIIVTEPDNDKHAA